MEYSKGKMYKVKLGEKELAVELSEAGNASVDAKNVEYDLKSVETGLWNIITNNKSYNVRLIERNDLEKTITLLVNNRSYTVELRDEFDELLEKMGMTAAAGALVNELKAPMPGLVVQIVAQPGTAVEKGDTLLILEAMKMENVIKSTGSATVKSVHVEQGQTVEKNQLLMSFE